jgi:hypothetical protein
MPQERAPVQTRIDTGPWTSKGKSTKKVIGQAWLKWFHVSKIPDRNANNPYFISVVKQTQQWGMWIALYYYGKSVRSNGTTEDENSSTYQESNDSSSRTPGDDGNNGDDTGGGTTSLATQGGGYKRPLSPFTTD